MKTPLFYVGLALLLTTPTVTLAQGMSSNDSPEDGRIITALPGRTIATGARARGIAIQQRIQNDHPSFCVRINVCLLDDQGRNPSPRAAATFVEGECMGVQVVSENPGYLYLLYKQADGSEKCLFPNKFEQNNRIEAGKTITVPDQNCGFNLRITPPFGEEALIALVTPEPLNADAFDNKLLTRSAATDINLDTVISRGVEAELREKPDQWAEHSINIETRAKGIPDVEAARGKKRIGIFVGISDYKDERISDLHICHLDAKVMAKVMVEQCNLDAVAVLTNSEATLAAVEKAFEELKEITKPGDDVFIYWSGHGASCANTGDEDNEPDGLDEFLVTYDTSPDDLENTVVMDDTLGRWIQALDGRHVAVILDACHSGGQSRSKGVGDDVSGAKALPGSQGGLFKELPKRDSHSSSVDEVMAAVSGEDSNEYLPWCFASNPADFLDGELRRIKDIGQDDASVLASSASDEISAESRDGKLSVMTRFLVQRIIESDSLTLQEAYEYVSKEVPKYMSEHYPGRAQTPVLVPEAANVTLK